MRKTSDESAAALGWIGIWRSRDLNSAAPSLVWFFFLAGMVLLIPGVVPTAGSERGVLTRLDHRTQSRRSKFAREEKLTAILRAEGCPPTRAKGSPAAVPLDPNFVLLEKMPDAQPPDFLPRRDPQSAGYLS